MQPSFSIPQALAGVFIYYYTLDPYLFSTIRTRPPSPLSVVRLVVSTDGEQYTVVDVTGAPDGAWIRQRIFAKLSVHEQSRGQFSIYPSEVGSYALGGALSDRRLHTLCRESGDPSGSLKLFVSTSPDRPPSALDTGYTRERFPVIINGHYNS